MRRVNRWTAKHEEAPRVGLRVNVQKLPGSIVYFKIKRCIGAINSGCASSEWRGWFCRVVLSEKKSFASELVFVSLNDKSVSYLLQWGTMVDFSRLLRRSLRWSDKLPLRRTCPACVPSHCLPVLSSSCYWSIPVVLCLLFLFSTVKTGSQVFRREDGWCQCPLRNWRIKEDNPRVKRYFWIPSPIVATSKSQNLVGHEL